MATELHNTGEQYQLETLNASGDTVEVGLFHDGEVSTDTAAGDDLSDASDVASITTEPSGGSYDTISLTLDGTDFDVTENASGNFELATVSNHTFDLSDDNDGTVDAYYVQVNFDDGSGAGDHLFFTGNLSQDYDVGSVGTLEIQAGGIGLSLD